jgi:primosomal protein N''
MAVRLAEGETKKKKDGEDEGPEQFKPRWQKVKGILQSKVKPTLKDLEQAVKEEDQKLTEYLFEQLLISALFLNEVIPA